MLTRGLLIGMKTKKYSSSIYQCQNGKNTGGKQTGHLSQDRAPCIDLVSFLLEAAPNKDT